MIRELACAEFVKCLHEQTLASDEVITGYIEASIPDDVPENRILNFCMELGSWVKVSYDHRRHINFANATIEKAAEAIGYECDKVTIAALAAMVAIRNAHDFHYDYLSDALAMASVRDYIENFDKYADSDNDVLFFAVYKTCSTLMGIAVKDFWKNHELIGTLSKNLMKCSERDNSIVFHGKEML